MSSFDTDDGFGPRARPTEIRYVSADKRLEIDFDDGGEIFAAVAEDNGFGDIRAGAQGVFDKGRRDGFAAGGDDE